MFPDLRFLCAVHFLPTNVTIYDLLLVTGALSLPEGGKHVYNNSAG